MNNIARYKLTTVRLAKLKTIKENRQYVGAGLSINLLEGTRKYNDGQFDNNDLDLEIADIETMDLIIDNLIQGTEISLKEQAYFINKDLKDLQDFATEHKL